jgi:uncharacterized membrane protein YhaH (DUF805 family)
MICSMFLFFYNNKNKIKIFGGEGVEIFFFFFLFLAFQILHVFLPDISVHCTLIDYSYI